MKRGKSCDPRDRDRQSRVRPFKRAISHLLRHLNADRTDAVKRVGIDAQHVHFRAVGIGDEAPVEYR